MVSESYVCYICHGYIHVDHDLLLCDVMIIRKGLDPREIVPVHSWCKRQKLAEYEKNNFDPQVIFERKTPEFVYHVHITDGQYSSRAR